MNKPLYIIFVYLICFTQPLFGIELQTEAVPNDSLVSQNTSSSKEVKTSNPTLIYIKEGTVTNLKEFVNPSKIIVFTDSKSKNSQKANDIAKIENSSPLIVKIEKEIKAEKVEPTTPKIVLRSIPASENLLRLGDVNDLAAPVTTVKVKITFIESDNYLPIWNFVIEQDSPKISQNLDYTSDYATRYTVRPPPVLS